MDTSPASQPSDDWNGSLATRLSPTTRPGLLDAATGFGLVWLACIVVLGVATGVVGVFHPLLVAGVAAVGAVLLVRPLWRTTERRLHRADLAVLVLVLCWVGFNAMHVGQHVFPGSDPGVYAGTGWWMAESPSPLIDMAPGILDATDGSFGASGFYDTGEATLAPQFPRGLPVVLALARSIGGPGGLFGAPVVIGGAGLLAVYAFASLLVSRWWSLLATAALAVNLVTVHFSRDAYSEPLTLLLLFGGAWLLIRSLDRDGAGMEWSAGLVFGAALCVRIDALIVMSLIPLLVVHATLLAGRGEVPLRRIGRATAVVVAAGAVALADLTLVDPSYLEAQGGRLGQVAVMVGLLAAFAFVAVRMRAPVRTFVQRHQVGLSRAVVGVFAAAAVYVFVIRPLGPPVRAGSHAFVGEVLGREGQDPDPSRTMAELTGWWLWWYLGPLLVAGVLGFLEMLRRTMRRPDAAATALVGLVAGTAVVYLWRPSIVPLHPWAMRRFLPVVIPGLTVLGVWFLAVVVQRFDVRWRLVGVVGATAIALGPLITLLPVTDTTEQRGAYSFVEGICGQLPPDAALFSDASATARQWGPALRIYCDVPVVVSSGSRLPDLMATAAEDFDVLWFGTCTVPGTYLVETAASFPILEFTATHAPNRLVEDFFGITIIEADSYDCV